jgi:hypothetical protein
MKRICLGSTGKRRKRPGRLQEITTSHSLGSFEAMWHALELRLLDVKIHSFKRDDGISRRIQISF